MSCRLVWVFQTLSPLSKCSRSIAAELANASMQTWERSYGGMGLRNGKMELCPIP